MYNRNTLETKTSKTPSIGNKQKLKTPKFYVKKD